MHQLQVKQQLHSHKMRGTYKHSSFLRVIILTQAFKTHTMAYVQNQKQTRKDKRKRFCAKVVKMFEFAKENIEFV